MAPALLAAVSAAAAASGGVPTKEVAPGVLMPLVSLGTGSSTRGQDISSAVQNWIAAGAYGIDTAYDYNDETAIGAGISASGAAREKLFITTKTPCDGSSVASEHDKNLKQLGVSYVDCLLVHFDRCKGSNMCTSWSAFQDILASGKAKSIGVSHWTESDFTQMKSCSGYSVTPAVNQVSFSVGKYASMKSMLAYMASINGTFMAFSPLGRGSVLSDKDVVSVANAHSVSPAQVALKWVLQHGATLAVGASSDHPEYVKEDIDLWSFTLTDAEMSKLDAVRTDE